MDDIPYEFKHPVRRQNAFWLKIIPKPDMSVMLLCAYEIWHVFNLAFSASLSDIWKESKACKFMAIPGGLSTEKMDEINNWCHKAGDKYIWPRIHANPEKPEFNPPVSAYFDEKVIDACIASDMLFQYDSEGNFSSDDRTPVGYARHQLKFNHCKKGSDDYKCCVTELSNALDGVLTFLLSHIGSDASITITNIPVAHGDTASFGWKLAKMIVLAKNLPFIDAQLRCTKPEMKNKPLSEKVDSWNEIYNNFPPNISGDDIRGKTLVIIDDLYQSGVSMLAYAKYLRQFEPYAIYGITCVRARGDKDNS